MQDKANSGVNRNICEVSTPQKVSKSLRTHKAAVSTQINENMNIKQRLKEKMMQDTFNFHTIRKLHALSVQRAKDPPEVRLTIATFKIDEDMAIKKMIKEHIMHRKRKICYE